jgi:hypothetical protein
MQRQNLVSPRVPSHFKAVYCLQVAWSSGEAVSACALLSADSWFDVRQEHPTPKLKAQFLLKSEESRTFQAETEAA